VSRIINASFLNRLLRPLNDPAVHKAAISLIDQATVSGTRFLTTLLVARFTGMDELGIYSIAVSMVLTVYAVEHALTTGPYTVFSARDDSQRKHQRAGSICIHFLLLSILFCFVLFIANSILNLWLGVTAASRVLSILSLCLPLLLLRDMARQFAFAHMQYKHAMLIDMLSSVSQLIILWFIVQRNDLSMDTAIYAIAISGVVASILWWTLYARQIQFYIPCILPDLKQHWQFGRWDVAAELLGTMQPLILLWLLASLADVQQAGIYSACLSISLLANPLILGLSSYFTPQLAHAAANPGYTSTHKLVKLASIIMGLSMLLLIIPIMFFSTDLLLLVFDTPEVIGQAATVNTIAIGMLIGVLIFGPEIALWANERTHLVFRASAYSLLLTTLAAVFLIPVYQALGAAIALLMGKCFSWLCNSYYYKKHVLIEDKP
jgi:O-antigen/teichoic acid export membrane protein